MDLGAAVPILGLFGQQEMSVLKSLLLTSVSKVHYKSGKLRSF